MCSECMYQPGVHNKYLFFYRLGKFTIFGISFLWKISRWASLFSVVFSWEQLIPQQTLGNVWVYFYCHNWRDGILLASLGCCYISYTAQEMSLPTTKHNLAPNFSSVTTDKSYSPTGRTGTSSSWENLKLGEEWILENLTLNNDAESGHRLRAVWRTK